MLLYKLCLPCSYGRSVDRDYHVDNLDTYLMITLVWWVVVDDLAVQDSAFVGADFAVEHHPEWCLVHYLELEVLVPLYLYLCHGLVLNLCPFLDLFDCMVHCIEFDQ